MKKIVLVLAMMMPMAMAMMAQEKMHAPQRHDGKDHIEKMAKELNLTPAQREKISKIFLDQMKEEKKLDEKRMKAHEKTGKKIMKVLTPEQQLKFNQMKEGQGRHHMGMGQGRPDGFRPDGMGPRPDGKRPNFDGKKGPRHDGKRPHFDGKKGPRTGDHQLPPPPQNGDDVKTAD